MQRVDEHGVMRIGAVGIELDRGGQKVVCDSGFGLGVHQHLGSRHRRRQGVHQLRCGDVGLLQPLRGLAEVTDHVGADVRGFQQPAGPQSRRRAEFGGPAQRGHGQEGVTAPDAVAGAAFELNRHLFVGPDRGTGQVPDPALRAIDEHSCQGAMRPPLSHRRRQHDHGGADQRMREGETVGGDVDHRQSGPLGRRQGRQHIDAGRGRLEHRKVAHSFQGAEQQQVAGRRRQPADRRRVHRAQLLGQRQHRRQRLLAGPLGGAERRGQLHQGERIALGDGQQVVPYADAHLGPAGVQQE
ncbi:hypothetical protein [Paractinoplanes brasiliensis]|uniref:hypothetical protein n=1 Tax=Paractinoplanes brasiliensis TaxID=52695 RepID=UPI001A4EF111|nr:hypothetical protein [Actinoplanes brasiliensis]GID33415.1 hypothetical protein Abr02nite_83980 [Actinoplanes brasiliensis]